MMVVLTEMWPEGDGSRRYPLSVATFTCMGQSAVPGDRLYRVRLYRDAQFGGPTAKGPLASASTWRVGLVRGHVPGRRGVWDLVGGAISALLGERLTGYRTATGERLEAVAPGAHTAYCRSAATRLVEDIGRAGDETLVARWAAYIEQCFPERG